MLTFSADELNKKWKIFCKIDTSYLLFIIFAPEIKLSCNEKASTLHNNAEPCNRGDVRKHLFGGGELCAYVALFCNSSYVFKYDARHLVPQWPICIIRHLHLLLSLVLKKDTLLWTSCKPVCGTIPCESYTNYATNAPFCELNASFVVLISILCRNCRIFVLQLGCTCTITKAQILPSYIIEIR